MRFCSALRDAIATGVSSKGFFKIPQHHINGVELLRIVRKTDERDADAVLRAREKSLIKMGFSSESVDLDCLAKCHF